MVHVPVTCLLVANTFPPLIGGSSAVYASLCGHARGQIAVLTSFLDYRTGTPHPGWHEHDRAAEYPIYRIPLVRPPLASGLRRRRFRSFASELKIHSDLMRAVTRLVRSQSVSAVCLADDETVGWLAAYARHVLGRRTLIYCHGDDLAGTSAAISLRRYWMQRASALIAASRFARERLVGAWGIPADRVVLVPNGADSSVYREQAALPSLLARYRLENAKVILTPSRLVARKGVDRTIEAMPAVLGRFPDAVYLVVGEGPQRQELETLAGRLGVSHAVRFAGAVAMGEMPSHYALADVVALPNRAQAGEEDGVSMVILEANACGKPVIGGLAGGTPEAIVNGDNGLLVDGGDPTAIARAIQLVLGGPALRERLRAGALVAARGADWQSRTDLFLAVCRGEAAGTMFN
ncbi:MAG TPA: glycosyltransferase family 4 protein [Rhizomicrobium sp.]|nr:glycosyltransferase family 4 protein [Rhizomicrobium sp.]